MEGGGGPRGGASRWIEITVRHLHLHLHLHHLHPLPLLSGGVSIWPGLARSGLICPSVRLSGCPDCFLNSWICGFLDCCPAVLPGCPAVLALFQFFDIWVICVSAVQHRFGTSVFLSVFQYFSISVWLFCQHHSISVFQHFRADCPLSLSRRQSDLSVHLLIYDG